MPRAFAQHGASTRQGTSTRRGFGRATGLRLAVGALAAFVACVTSTVAAAAEPAAVDWNRIGLLRVRDLTPFGILRLDFLPAHAVSATPGTWALETTLSYQNTYVLSENVAAFLAEREGGSRVEVSADDAAAILGSGEESYLVDLELGLLDLTVHYRFSRHWGAYLTVPMLSFQDGYLDGAIEGFHDEFGFSTAHRDLARRDDFAVVVGGGDGAGLVILEPPPEGVGDPVLGARYSLEAKPDRWNMVVEAAWKVAWRDDRPFLSSGRSDVGLQLSLQRFFARQALYLTASAVYFGGSDNPVTPDFQKVIPTVVLGWERRLTRHTNAVLQLYTSPSVIGPAPLADLEADKYLLSLGLQSRRGGWYYRVALTENLQNFNNTPDVGLSFSVARVVLGRVR